MIKVLPHGLIHKITKFSDPSNPGSLVSTRDSDVPGSTSHGIRHKRCDSGVLGLLGVRKGTEKKTCVLW